MRYCGILRVLRSMTVHKEWQCLIRGYHATKIQLVAMETNIRVVFSFNGDATFGRCLFRPSVVE